VSWSCTSSVGTPLPSASVTRTTTAGVIVPPTAIMPGCWVKAIVAGGPTVTVMGPLTPVAPPASVAVTVVVSPTGSRVAIVSCPPLSVFTGSLNTASPFASNCVAPPLVIVTAVVLSSGTVSPSRSRATTPTENVLPAVTGEPGPLTS
jgi:hypothetical protein